ncbi:hypothetical protein [Streptomyces hydrogenans]|uniref:hypothetical protein n=1 Tax=Streptomyces hydrogenans TaxID=1873719 RepID=UPI0038012CBD
MPDTAPEPRDDHPFPSTRGVAVPKPEWVQDEERGGRRITEAVEQWRRETGR